MDRSTEPETALSAPPAAVLETRGLGLFQQGRWLFRNLSVRLEGGQFVAVTGPSGVGKTSLLACLAGLRAPTEGEVAYRLACGALAAGDVTAPKEVFGPSVAPAAFRHHLGLVFQHLRLAENAPLLTNVLCGRLNRYRWWQTLFGFPKEDRAEAYRLLCSLGVGAGDIHRPVAESSGGERQRIAMARTLLQDPPIIFADEPVSQLDPVLTQRVLERLKELTEKRGRLVLCVLHDPANVRRFADQVLTLSAARGEGWSVTSPTEAPL